MIGEQEPSDRLATINRTCQGDGRSSTVRELPGGGAVVRPHLMARPEPREPAVPLGVLDSRELRLVVGPEVQHRGLSEKLPKVEYRFGHQFSVVKMIQAR